MKRFATTTLAACLLSLGTAYGVQAQEHHRGRDQRDQNDQPQAQAQPQHDQDQSRRNQQNQQAPQQQHARQEDQRSRDYQSSYDARTRQSQQESQRQQAQNRESQLRTQREYQDNDRRQREDFDRQRDSRFRANVYVAPSFSYRIGGFARTTDRYGAEMLQRAVSDGYEQGFEFGLADRRDRRGFGPHDSYGWRDGMFGYDGQYLDRGDYQYYFRQGFDRGYDDAFYGRHQYGSIGSNGKAFILGTVLGTVLGFSLH